MHWLRNCGLISTVLTVFVQSLARSNVGINFVHLLSFKSVSSLSQELAPSFTPLLLQLYTKAVATLTFKTYLTLYLDNYTLVISLRQVTYKHRVEKALSPNADEELLDYE